MIGRAELVFIAHFLHFSYSEMMDMEMKQLAAWYAEAVKLYNNLNRSE